MTKRLNHIIMQTDPLTKEEMQAYIDGNLSPEEMHKVELKMASNQLNDDAMDGFKQTPGALAGFAAIENKFLNNPGSQLTSTSGAGSAFGTSMIISFSIAIITTLGLSIANESFKSTVKNTENPRVFAQNETIDNGESIDESLYETVKEEEIVEAEIEAELADVQPTIGNKQITSEIAMAIQQEAEKPVDNEEDNDSENTSVVVEPISIATPEFIATSPSKSIAKSNVSAIFLHNLKIVDVSSLYSNKIRVRNLNDVSGTRVYNADKAANRDNSAIISGPYIYVDYLEYLNDAMRDFENNNFKQALKSYRVILEHYPDDINAFFYGALCYYNLGKSEKAIVYFERVKLSQINTFDLEADFYIAKSLAQAGKIEEAKDAFLKIEKEGEFYAKRAREERLKL